MTYREARMEAARRLANANIENESAESWFLMEFVCEISRSFYLLHEQDVMPEDQEHAFFEMTEKRCSHIPLQYLTGEQEFMGLPFQVNENVLIPRQDTEVLVEEALKVISDGNMVLDMCTGSGCIAVSIQFLCPGAEVIGCDVSAGALEVARENGKRNNVSVKFIDSDLFSNIEGRYDVIVSNPPYIPSDVIPTLMPEVRDFEPVSALDGRSDGLFFYRRIVEESSNYLVPGGYLLFEIGYDQGDDVSLLMKKNGFYEIEVVPDLAGLDRVVKGRRKEYV